MKRNGILGLAFCVAIVCLIATSARADELTYVNCAGGSGIQVYDTQTGALVQTDFQAQLRNFGNGRRVVRVGDILCYPYASSNAVHAYNVATNTALNLNVPESSSLIMLGAGLLGLALLLRTKLPRPSQTTLKVGQIQQVQNELETALRLQGTFDGSAEANKVLSSISAVATR